MKRRQFLAVSGLAPLARAQSSAPSVTLRTDSARLQSTYDAALEGLRANVRTVFEFPRPVLIEGATYIGVWLECAPLESLVYAPIAPDVALNTHEIYFDLQREDGYIPCNVKADRKGTGQIQMVVPIAATAWDLYRQNRKSAFLEKAYRACARWDEWLLRYRNTRGTGLCEAFCTYDTGHDNSPRFAGKPNQCPNADARVCPKVDGLPYLAPDLSATVYGGRIALAAMARELNKPSEESRWLESAATLQALIVKKLYDAHDHAFYDIDSNDHFVRVRGDLMTRVMGEHVSDRALFEEVWRNQLHNPKAFWTPYPFPSIAIDDPKFVRPIPRNSWGGASQALTALRTPRWMEHYGQYAAQTHLMKQWVEAIARSGQFLQQMDPVSGEFSPDRGAYSPDMLSYFDFAWRLYGVRPSADEIEWNCRLPEGAREISTKSAAAELRTTARGSELKLSGRTIASVTGAVRLVTAADGKPRKLIGTEPTPVTATFRGRSYPVKPDQVLPL